MVPGSRAFEDSGAQRTRRGSPEPLVMAPHLSKGSRGQLLHSPTRALGKALLSDSTSSPVQWADDYIQLVGVGEDDVESATNSAENSVCRE